MKFKVGDTVLWLRTNEVALIVLKGHSPIGPKYVIRLLPLNNPVLTDWCLVSDAARFMKHINLSKLERVMYEL